MGLTSSSVLCFVIDTTGSMSDDIVEAKRVSFEIIDSKRGTQQEPSAYILVPFNDPGWKHRVGKHTQKVKLSENNKKWMIVYL